MLVTRIADIARLCLCGLVLAVALVAAAPPGRAASGDWVRADHSAVRLLQGETEGQVLMAGVEIELRHGWKTYWRMPGESGVPAEFDWSASHNIAAVEVGWPAPRRMHDAAGEGVGYKDHVVFPLAVRLNEPGKPARLDIKLFYAVCNDICVPAKAELAIDLDAAAASSADAVLIARYRGLMPVEDSTGRSLLSARALDQAGRPYLAVTVAPDLAGARDVDIFVEGIDQAYFRAPRPALPVAAGADYLLPVDGIAAAAALSGKMLRITWVAGDRSLFRDLKVE